MDFSTLASLEPGMAHIVAAVITAAASANMLFLKWLIKSFSDLRDCIQNLNKEIKHLSHEYHILLDRHEEKDQNRHEENLERFSTIAVSLTKLERK